VERKFDEAWSYVRSLTIAYRSVGLTLEKSYFLRRGIDYLGQAEDYFTRDDGTSLGESIISEILNNALDSLNEANNQLRRPFNDN
jgi:hypothetical protein